MTPGLAAVDTFELRQLARNACLIDPWLSAKVSRFMDALFSSALRLSRHGESLFERSPRPGCGNGEFHWQSSPEATAWSQTILAPALAAGQSCALNSTFVARRRFGRGKHRDPATWSAAPSEDRNQISGGANCLSKLR